MRRHSFAGKLARLLVVGAGLALGIVVTASYISTRRLLVRELEAKAGGLALAMANRVETVRRAVEKVGSALAREVLERRLQPSQARPLLRSVVVENEEVYGAELAFEPRQTANGLAYDGASIYRKGSSLAEDNMTSAGFEYPTQDWYTMARELGRPTWSEPYFDDGNTKILTATYAVPLYDPNKKFLGIAAIDISLDWLSELLGSLPLATGYAFAVSGNGTFIAHRDRELIMSESIFSVAEERGDAELRRIGQRMIHGESGFVPMLSFIHRRPSYMAFAPIRSTGWSIGLLFPRHDVLEPVHWMTFVQAGLGVAGFAILLLVVIVITGSATKPLRQLAAATRRLGEGQLEVALPQVSGKDEIAELTTAFSSMRRELGLYLTELQATTAAKERIESELRVAREIQLGLLPRTPGTGLPDQVELCATLEPAREVGGDFYDFFVVDQQHLAVLIADVSGKGVPAALLMAQCDALARVFGRQVASPQTVLCRLNEELARDNDAAMFVTLFYASIELQSGRCRYASAGHPSPLLLGASGEVKPLPRVPGLVLGAMPGVSFEEGEVTLQPGDTLLLYTDGVSEAMNVAGGLFGEARLSEATAKQRGLSCREVLTGLRAELRAFTAGAPQSDDMAMLAVKLRGPI